MVRRTLGIHPASRNVTGGTEGTAGSIAHGVFRLMDSMEFNKLVASVLVAGITFFVCGVIGQSLVAPRRLHETAIKIEGLGAAPAAGAKEEVLTPIGPLLASADAAAGAANAKKLCAACHTFTEGGKAGVGPNLYNAVNANRAATVGFTYSNGLKAKAGAWGYEDLNAWLKKPAAYAAGTKMAFAGITNDKQRADMVAYLRSLSKSPAALP